MCYIKMLKENWKEILITVLLAGLAYFLLPTFLQPKTEEESYSILFNAVPLITILLMFLSFFIGSFISRSNSENLSKHLFVPMVSALILSLIAIIVNLLSLNSVMAELAFEASEMNDAVAFAIYGFSSVLFESLVIIGTAFCAIALFRLIYKSKDVKGSNSARKPKSKK